jgi:sialic acid synthase SpsE
MVVFIADIGSNFETIDQAHYSIAAAARAGADVVKFQLFSEHCLYGSGSDALPLAEHLPALAETARQYNVSFGCTAFSTRALALVDPHVDYHKIASSCLTHMPLLEAVRDTGKPVHLSTGASTLDEIRMAMGILGNINLVLFYCAAAYPSRKCDTRRIKTLRSLFYGPIGFSDHTTDIINAPASAVDNGATYIEKHFTAFPDLQTPDRPHSLTPCEFSDMVKAIREPSFWYITEEELEFVRLHKVRLTENGYCRVRKC